MQENWVFEQKILYYEALIFFNTIKGIMNSYLYDPIAIARHEQYGMKYHFLCIAKPMSSPQLISHFAVIEIFQPVSGIPYATKLLRIEIDI